MKIFELFGEIKLDGLEGAEKGMDRLDKKGGGLSKAFGIMGKGALVVGGAIGTTMAAALVHGVKGTMEMEKHASQLESVLKSTKGAAGVTADEVMAMADALEKTTKFTTESTLAGQNLLLTFTNIGADVFPDVTETMLDMATAMGTDASSQAIALGKALNDPVAGVASLTRVGVQFTDGQKESIAAMMEMGDIAGAQKVILAELDTQFGGSAEAAGKTFAGQIEIAKNMVGEMTEGLVSSFMPTLQTMLEWVIAHMPEIQAFMSKAFEVIGIIVDVLVDTFKTYLLPILKTLFEWVKENMPAIQGVFKTAFDTMTNATDMLWAFVMDYLMPIFKKIFELWEDNLPTIQRIFENVFGAAYDVVQVLWDVFKGLWDFMEPTFPLIEAIVETAFGAVITIVDDVTTAFRTLVGWVRSAVEWLEKFDRKKINDSGTFGNISGELKQFTNGSHANGLDYVPFDGYTATLHKGERVMTAEENRQGSVGSPITVQTMVVREEADIKKVARELYNMQIATSRGGGF